MTNQEDRNVFKTLSMVIAALTVFFIFSILAARTVSASDEMVEAAIIERIKPFGEVNIAGQTPAVAAAPAAATSTASAADGKGTYTKACSFCHTSGAAGSPKFGDKGAWKSRIAQGEATLFDHAINGFKGMPAKGGNASLSDDAVKAAVQYIVNNSK